VKIAPIRGRVAALAAAVALLTGAGSAQATPLHATRTATVTPAMPRAYRLTLHEQYQATTYYCVPAATSMSLSTFGVQVSQDVLARKMKTTVRGTGGDIAASVMDSYLHPRRFDDRIVGDVLGHPEILMQRVSYDVGSLRRAPIIQVWMERLPWNRGKIHGQWIGHAILAYGYNQQAGTITVFDPWRPTGGTHTLPAQSLATTLQGGAGMHYISRT
jgi:Peptidase_C39 like family